ncbi:hypothetical protein BDN72DRAFT_842231 [Pluteus cervinus]|uniref:Uncharacterized protein n=1 Tax=Pluteus cervinus TaxID=181527 RepID=A0ACD3AS26_9AGAR|nr:hypothetical protein BDN72DRAFT_842231 [Pluteus cervinus]
MFIRSFNACTVVALFFFCDLTPRPLPDYSIAVANPISPTGTSSFRFQEVNDTLQISGAVFLSGQTVITLLVLASGNTTSTGCNSASSGDTFNPSPSTPSSNNTKPAGYIGPTTSDNGKTFYISERIPIDTLSLNNFTNSVVGRTIAVQIQLNETDHNGPIVMCAPIVRERLTGPLLSQI